jgi:hypothetical protein
MTSKAFKVQCQDYLSAGDMGLLDLCTLEPDPSGPVASEKNPMIAYVDPPRATGSDFIDSWRKWERSLRLNLARLRALRLKRKGADAIEPPDYPANAVNAAKAAVVMDSPLEAELFLDKTRWETIENLQGLDFFSVNTIYAYLLKLQLMERRALFKVEEGFAEYKGLYASIMDTSMSENASKRNESGEPK